MVPHARWGVLGEERRGVNKLKMLTLCKNPQSFIHSLMDLTLTMSKAQ